MCRPPSRRSGEQVGRRNSGNGAGRTSALRSEATTRGERDEGRKSEKVGFDGGALSVFTKLRVFFARCSRGAERALAGHARYAEGRPYVERGGGLKFS
jgi:hypothetical protein